MKVHTAWSVGHTPQESIHQVIKTSENGLLNMPTGENATVHWSSKFCNKLWNCLFFFSFWICRENRKLGLLTKTWHWSPYLCQAYIHHQHEAPSPPSLNTERWIWKQINYLHSFLPHWLFNIQKTFSVPILLTCSPQPVASNQSWVERRHPNMDC